MRQLNAGGYDFAVDSSLQADRAPLFWLPRLDPTAVLLAPAPVESGSAYCVGNLAPTFVRRATDGTHWIVNGREGRCHLVLTGGATAATPVVAATPLDADFAVRSEATLRLWRMLAARPRGRSHDRLTQQRRQRLVLTLRALDAHVAEQPYRAIAQVLFGSRVPVGSSWKTHDLRDRTIRLVRTGSKLMSGGYLDLLQHSRHR